MQVYNEILEFIEYTFENIIEIFKVKRGNVENYFILS